MKKRDSFIKTYFVVLVSLIPFMLLALVGGTAVLSDGLWSVFFLKLPLYAVKYALPFWALVSLYVAFARRNAGVATGSGGGGGFDDGPPTYAGRDAGDYNPATGLPTVGGVGTMDVAGHDYGRND